MKDVGMCIKSKSAERDRVGTLYFSKDIWSVDNITSAPNDFSDSV